MRISLGARGWKLSGSFAPCRRRGVCGRGPGKRREKGVCSPGCVWGGRVWRSGQATRMGDRSTRASPPPILAQPRRSVALGSRRHGKKRVQQTSSQSPRRLDTPPPAPQSPRLPPETKESSRRAHGDSIPTARRAEHGDSDPHLLARRAQALQSPASHCPRHWPPSRRVHFFPPREPPARGCRAHGPLSPRVERIGGMTSRRRRLRTTFKPVHRADGSRLHGPFETLYMNMEERRTRIVPETT